MTLHSQPCPLVCWFLKRLIVGLTESALDHIHAILESLQTSVTEVEDVAITIYSLPLTYSSPDGDDSCPITPACRPGTMLNYMHEQ